MVKMFNVPSKIKLFAHDEMVSWLAVNQFLQVRILLGEPNGALI